MPSIERAVLGSACPHCGKSNMLPEDNPDCCQCALPAPMEHTAIYHGDPVKAAVPNQGIARFLPARRHISGNELHLHLVMSRRWHLYHFVEGLRFHLESCEKLLAGFDKDLKEAKERGEL